MIFLHLTDTVGDLVNIGEDATSIVKLAEGIQKYGFIAIGFAVVVVVFLIIIGFVFFMNMKVMRGLMERNDNNADVADNLVKKLVEEVTKKYANGIISIDELNKIKQDLSTQLDSATNKLEHELEKHDNKVDSASKHETDFVGKFVDDQNTFKTFCKPLIGKLGCSRVGIYVFHNGNASIHGLPFYKMTCIYECNNMDKKSMRGMHHTNMPLNLYYDFVEDLYRTGEYKVDDITELVSDDYAMKEFTEFSNCKSMYIVAVKDSNDNIGGFVIVEFDKVETFCSDEERMITVRTAINETIYNINPILIGRSIYKK